MNKSILISFVCWIFALHTSFGQKEFVYKTLENDSLTFMMYPSQVNRTSPGMVFYFGGGWNSGSIAQFEKHAQYFSARGITCFLVTYRTKSSHGTTPFESLKDAKSAFRFIKKNAETYNVDPEKLIASGGSAGGHLAAALATVHEFNDENDDLSISVVPAALVLFNPVVDNGPAGYGYKRIRDNYTDFSPLHNLNRKHPPTIFFLGDRDNLIPVETAKYYQKALQKLGTRCDLHIYENAKHGFFNYRNFEFYKSTVQRADDFLVSLGFLDKTPEITIK